MKIQPLQLCFIVLFLLFISGLNAQTMYVRKTNNTQSDYVLVLEHDWNLIEDREITYERLKRSISAIELGMNVELANIKDLETLIKDLKGRFAVAENESIGRVHFTMLQVCEYKRD